MQRRLLPDLATAIALLAAVPLAIGPLFSADLFFHMASGRWILEHHGFPSTDPFSFTASGAQFPHEYAFGVLAELSTRLFGASGPKLLVATLVTTSILLVWRTLGPRESRGLVAAGALGLALVAQSYTWHQERPFHLGQVLFPTAVLVLQRWRAGARWAAWAFVPLTAAWANLHGSWLLAPALLGASAVGRVLDGWSDPAERRLGVEGGIAAVLAFLASAVSPGGFHMYDYVIRHALLHSTAGIQEWMPIDLGSTFANALVALLLLCALATGAARKRPLALLVPMLGLGLAAVRARRHAAFAGMFCAAALAELAVDLPWPAVPAALAAALGEVEARLRAWSARAGGEVLPYAALALLGYAAAQHPMSVRDGTARLDFPLGSLDVLKTLPPGPVLNRFHWGGAISYFAGTDYKVFIDGRNDPFPDQIHQDHDALVRVDLGWEERLAKYNPRYLVWEHDGLGNALLEVLACRGGWREVAHDDAGVLWEKTDWKPRP
jgi:hypothetical protein